MGHIAEKSGFHGLNERVREPGKIRLAVRRAEHIAAFAGHAFLADPVLAEDQVFHAVPLVEFRKILENVRIILDFQSDVDLQLIRVLFPEFPDTVHIVGQQLGAHADVRLQVGRAEHGRMVREPQDPDAVCNRGKNVVLVLSLGMVAAESVSMVIRNHEKPLGKICAAFIVARSGRRFKPSP